VKVKAQLGLDKHPGCAFFVSKQALFKKISLFVNSRFPQPVYLLNKDAICLRAIDCSTLHREIFP
jgi:hypothetical protein